MKRKWTQYLISCTFNKINLKYAALLFSQILVHLYAISKSHQVFLATEILYLLRHPLLKCHAPLGHARKWLMKLELSLWEEK